MTFRVTLFTTVLDKDLFLDYGKYAFLALKENKSKTEKATADELQRHIEAQFATKFGFKVVGTTGKTLEPDFIEIIDEEAVPGFLSGTTPEAKILARETGVAQISKKTKKRSFRALGIGQAAISTLIKDEVLDEREFSVFSSNILKKGAEVDPSDGLLDQLKDAKGKEASDFIFNNIFVRFPKVKAKFYNKAKDLIIFNLTDKTARAVAVNIPPNKFNTRFFEAKIGGDNRDKIVLSLRGTVEREIIKALAKAEKDAILGPVNKYLQGFTAFKNKSARKRLIGKVGQGKNAFIFDISIRTATGGSIPMVIGQVVKRKSKRRAISKGRFISSVQFSALLQKRMDKQMPEGPVGGTPLSEDFLTNRTRTFLTSVRVIINYRNNLIRYFYDPRYIGHELTSRAPGKQIEGNIRQITQQLFGRQFNIIRAV